VLQDTCQTHRRCSRGILFDVFVRRSCATRATGDVDVAIFVWPAVLGFVPTSA